MAARNDVQRMDTDEDAELEINLIIMVLLERLIAYEASYLNKQPVHDQTYTGNQKVFDMLHGHWRVCFDTCRVMPEVFMKLCRLLRDKGLARSSRTVSVEEQMRIFLQTIGHNDRNRSMQDTLRHSGETISRYFNEILNAICALAPDVICNREPLTSVPNHILHYGGGKYYPFFKNCVGALDGTHVHASVPSERHLAFRSGRSKTTTQNVLGVCDFHMRFTFVCAGWEGTAHDSKVLAHSVYNPDHNFPLPPPNKYYVVDAGYANRNGFLAPYRNTRYHLPDFQRAGPRGKEEVFNSLHSSLRNVIERSFGILKKRFPILNLMPNYPYRTQVKIVVAAIIIHNFIIDQKINDELTNTYEDELFPASEGLEGESTPSRASSSDECQMSAVRDAICNEIAAAHGNARR